MARVTPEDRSLILRVVGFLEYASALRNFDELLATATPEELSAIDAVVSSRPEFAVYANLSRRVRRAPSTLAETQSEAEDTFQRRGLPWVIALARVEMGGMIATFLEHPAPFAAVQPSAYEMEAYKELVLDGSQSHFWALTNDPNVQSVARQKPDAQMLAYIRRLGVARHFLFAAARSHAPQLNALQIQEALAQKTTLEDTLGDYRGNLQSYLESRNQTARTSSSKTTWSGDVVNACYKQLAREPKALAMGTAKVTTP
jgi:hypothetical protein